MNFDFLKNLKKYFKRSPKDSKRDKEQKKEEIKKEYSTSPFLPSNTVIVPDILMEHMPSIMEKVKAQMDKESDLYSLVDLVKFQPLGYESGNEDQMPTYVFIINEGEIRPYPAQQINAREIVINFGNKYEEIEKKVYGKVRKYQEGRDMLRKKFFCGVNAHILTLPREFFDHPSAHDKKLPKFLHMRVFAMFWGEPFVRNFFTFDIVDKKEKWEQLVQKNIAEKIFLDEQDQMTIIKEKEVKGQRTTEEIKQDVPENVKIYRDGNQSKSYIYKIKNEYCVDIDKPVYDINSFDFAKAEQFEQEMSKTIVMAIRALL